MSVIATALIGYLFGSIPAGVLVGRLAGVGRPFGAAELGALGVSDAGERLESLRERGIIATRSRKRVGAEREYRFRIALVSEVAYQMLADDLRAKLHRRAAEFLDAQTEKDMEEIAVHWDRGGEQTQAANAYADAVRDAAKRADGASVMRCSDTAFYLGVAERYLYDIHFARAGALRLMGRFEEQHRELEGALEHGVSAGQRGRAFSERIGCLWRLGKRDEALKTADEAAELADLAGDNDLLAMTVQRRANVLILTGRLEDAATLLDGAEQLAANVSAHGRAFIASARGLLGYAVGDIGEQKRWFLEAHPLYTEAGDFVRATTAEASLADALVQLGAYEEAEEALRHAIRRCRRLGNRGSEAWAHMNLAGALARMGRPAQAAEELEKAAPMATETGDPVLAVGAQTYRAWIHLLEGNLGAAASTAEAASRLAEARALPARKAQALTLVCNARLRNGDQVGALEASDAAMAIHEELGKLDEDVAELFLAHAGALRANGRAADAESVLARGRKWLTDTSAGIRDSEQRRGFLETVPANRTLARTGKRTD